MALPENLPPRFAFTPFLQHGAGAIPNHLGSITKIVACAQRVTRRARWPLFRINRYLLTNDTFISVSVTLGQSLSHCNGNMYRSSFHHLLLYPASPLLTYRTIIFFGKHAIEFYVRKSKIRYLVCYSNPGNPYMRLTGSLIGTYLIEELFCGGSNTIHFEYLAGSLCYLPRYFRHDRLGRS